MYATGSRRLQATGIQIKSNQIKSNQIKSNQIKSNQIKSNQIKASQVKSSQVKSSKIKSSQVKSSQIKSSQIKSNQDDTVEIEINCMERNSRLGYWNWVDGETREKSNIKHKSISQIIREIKFCGRCL